MTDNSVPGLGDLIALLGGANLLAPVTKTIDQMKRGISDFLTAVENFNRTMETVNDIAVRANALFDEIEEPLKALVPQVTRSLKVADAMITQISGPIDKVAPGITRLADVLSSPSFIAMPADMANFVDVMTDVARRMQPLGQMAETAAGAFGLRQLGSIFGGGTRTAPPAPAPAPAPVPVKKVAPRKAPVAKSAAKKTAANKTAAKRTAAKKATPRKAAPKTVAKKAPTKR